MLNVIFMWVISAYAQDPLLERYCFPSQEEAQRAVPIISTVLVRGRDSLSHEGACINIQISQQRLELLQRWIANRLPQAQLAFSTASVSDKECDMVITKHKQKKAKGQDVSVGGQHFEVHATAETEESSDQFLVKTLSGKSVQFMMDGTELNIVCTWHPSETYRLQFSQVEKTIQPSTLPTPTPQTTSALQSELEVTKGQRVELGKVLKDLGVGRKSIGIPQGIQLESTEGEQTFRWTLLMR